MLAVQCFALFFAAPFGALGHPVMRSVTELLLVAYVLLVLLVSHNRKIRILAMTVSGCGLASGILNLSVPSAPPNLLAHAISVIAFMVLGYVVAQAVFLRDRLIRIEFSARSSSTSTWCCFSVRFIG